MQIPADPPYAPPGDLPDPDLPVPIEELPEPIGIPADPPPAPLQA